MITVTRGQWFPLTLGDIMYNGAAVDLSKCTDITVNLVSGLGMKTGLHVEASGYNEVSCYQEGTMAAGVYKVELTYKDEQGRAYRMCTPRALVRISDGTTPSSGGWEHVGGDGWELTADVEMREALAKTYMSLLEEARQNALKVQKNSNVSFAGTINASAKTKEDVGLKDMADGEVNIYVIADGEATSGGYVKFLNPCKDNFVNLTGTTVGASRGDLLLVRRSGDFLVAKVLPLNDAKAANEKDGFPGANGLETVWDKTQINKIPGLQNSVAGIENREAKTRDGINMNDNLQTGFYPYCTLGRPSGSGDGCWYTLRTWRSKDADNNGYYTVEQIAVARGGNYLGCVFYRIIFVKDDRTGDNFRDWVEISKNGESGGLKDVASVGVNALKNKLELFVNFNSYDHDTIDYMCVSFPDGKYPGVGGVPYMSSTAIQLDVTNDAYANMESGTKAVLECYRKVEFQEGAYRLVDKFVVTVEVNG